MASRSIAAELVRQLDAVSVPLCVFDEGRRLVFLNRACADWVGLPAEQLTGQRGSYTATTDGQASAPVDRLYPPPEAFRGKRMVGFVYSLPHDGALRRRHADFFPLDRGQATSPVLVICGSADLADDDNVPSAETPYSTARADDDPQLLHDRVAQFQSKQRKRWLLDRFIGDSPAVQVVRAQVHVAIMSRANVTLVGPPGSGREHLARAIHYSRSNDSTGESIETLVPLDCRVLIDEVLAGASRTLSTRGRNEAATILLLHLEALPRELQAEFVRLFLHRSGHVRLLATSSDAPDALVTEARLDVHLAAALNTLIIRLPPLAERRQDIPILAQRLVEELNAQVEKQLGGIAPEAIDALVSYTWPGNVEELNNSLREAHQRAQGTLITLADLPRRLLIAADIGRRAARTDEPIILEDFLAGVERELIGRALNQARGNKARAARLLGLTRPRLYRRMVQLGMDECTGETAARSAKAGSGSLLQAPKARRTVKRVQGDTISDSELPDAGPDETGEFVDDIPFEEQTD
jgi:DNA-binding NtrC family response regulator